LILACLFLAEGCRRDMYDQPRSKPAGENTFFRDGADARPIPAHTVARGGGATNEAFYTGQRGGKLVEELPVPLTRSLLERGQDRYEIYCAVCHGRTGAGDGLIVERGFPAPPSYHSERLWEVPIGYFFDVITHGYGVMYPYGARVQPEDRWAMAAYIRVLQLSRRATLRDVPPTERALLEKTRP
jgi:mono/diheme cytochrome c family protein